MSCSIFNKLACSRRIVSTASILSHAASGFMGSSSPASKISSRPPMFLKNTLENEPRPPDSVLLASLYRPGPLALNFNVGKNGSSFERWRLTDAIIGDYLRKHSGLDTLYLDAMLWKLLTSDQRFKDLGVYYKPAPIPDKNEWKSSWFQEGKPNWLGTVPTRADDCLCNTALIDGFLDEEGGKGGYAVILIDNHARPKVAAVGYSPKGSLFLFELLGIRAALRLALDTGSGAWIRLTTHSSKVDDLFLHLSYFEDVDMTQTCQPIHHNYNHDDARICLACVGLHLFKHFITKMEDFVVLYPVILEILELRRKLNCYGGISPNLSQASVYLGKCYGTPTTDEMKLFLLLDCKYELYETVMKPDKFPEKLEDILYHDCFKGYRYYGQDILGETEPGSSELLSAVRIFDSIENYKVLLGIGSLRSEYPPQGMEI